MLNFLPPKREKRPTYLLKLKLMGRNMGNKYIFKDGLMLFPDYRQWAMDLRMKML